MDIRTSVLHVLAEHSRRRYCPWKSSSRRKMIVPGPDHLVARVVRPMSRSQRAAIVSHSGAAICRRSTPLVGRVASSCSG